ncbi:DUF3597 domain-containing protein [Lichenifustis flavocetrariae]|uniref:DUF3597 domain-containing protein n=1 Tax=Lichenifustis flavocetrariae TaxID=2949735 RepID=A0AA42CML8_9HYPH|nr:DUF3597 domain-containing protein [Lichenifustis flavocetrariae]MCW6508522.1 DUF3597 domain-containing protein [Lichenifustis flavocetrariae]
MSIFGSIMNKIFNHASAAPAPSAPSSPAAPAPSSFNNPSSAAPSPGQTSGATPPASSGTAAQAPVDVGAVLTDLASKSSQKLDWQHSIVDLMKLLDLDSSLSNRQELAKELHYSGSMEDSASMNIWLHKQVMQKLAANGGKVPDDLK